jgi:hypothetical protein
MNIKHKNLYDFCFETLARTPNIIKKKKKKKDFCFYSFYLLWIDFIINKQ